jgi:hypothetical protein
LKDFFERLEKIPDSTLLLVNAGLGGFVLLAHGGALLIVLRGTAPAPPDYAAMIRTLAPFSLLSAWLVATGSAFGFVRPRSRRLVLAAQALILLLSGAGLLVWASRIVVEGIPDVNFGWTPGLLTGWVVYSVFLCARVVLPARWRQYPSLAYLVVAACVLTVPVDLGVCVRQIAKMSRMTTGTF